MQKHAGQGPQREDSMRQKAGEDDVLIDRPKAEQIVLLAQFNAIEIHGWGSRLPKVEKPDWVVFDLDPDEALPFSRVVEAALSMKELR